jgi:hypothetical protein
MSTEARAASSHESEARAALARLEVDGFVTPDGASYRTSRRWQQAMARAAVQLYDAGDPGEDLRVPIALALVEIYSGQVEDEVLVDLVEAMLPIETASLGLRDLRERVPRDSRGLAHAEANTQQR